MERKIIVEDREDLPATKSGYPAGMRLHSGDGRIYQVDHSGAFRRITPKPSSKKARRKANKA